VYKKSF